MEFLLIKTSLVLINLMVLGIIQEEWRKSREVAAEERRKEQFDSLARVLWGVAAEVSGVCPGEQGAPPVNGEDKEETCWLRLSQMSFAGTHNSGAYGTLSLQFLKLPAPSCAFINQGQGVKQQLDTGVRAFDFDVARYYTGEEEVRLVHCYLDTCGYGDSLRSALLDIQQFLSDPQFLPGSANQIVLIRIKNHVVEDSTERVLLTQAILELIESTLGERMLNYHTDPLIASVLILKRPVFFYLHPDLWRSIKLVPQQLRYLASYIRPLRTIETWYATEDQVKVQCDLREDAVKYLDRNSDVMRNYPWIPVYSDWYKSDWYKSNVCQSDGAIICNKRLKDNVKIAEYLLSNYNRTINVLMTDFTDIETVKLVNDLNKLNRKHFVTKKQGLQLLEVGQSNQTSKYPFVVNATTASTGNQSSAAQDLDIL